MVKRNVLQAFLRQANFENDCLRESLNKKRSKLHYYKYKLNGIEKYFQEKITFKELQKYLPVIKEEQETESEEEEEEEEQSQ